MVETPGPIAGAAARIVGWIVSSKARAAIVLCLALIVGALGLAYGWGIDVDTDLKALLPPDSKSLRALDEVKARTGATEVLSVAVEGPDDAANARVIEALATDVQSWDETVEAVSVGRDYTELRNHGLYFMSVEDLQKLRDTLVEERQKSVAAAMSIGDGPGPDASDVVAGDDWDTFGDLPEVQAPTPQPGEGGDPPGGTAGDGDELPTDGEGRVDLRQWLRDQKQALYESEDLTRTEVDLVWLDEDPEGDLIWRDEVLQPFVSKKGDARFLRAKLSKPPTNVRFAQDVYGRMQGEFDALIAQGIANEDQRVVVTGAYDVSADVDQILVDLKWATWVSATLVLLVLTVGFRRARGVLLVIVPLGLAMVVTLGVARLIYGELNALTAFLFAVLFGMGVDFAVHLFSQRQRQGAEADWPKLIEGHFRPLLATMLTTAGSLFVLSIAVFKAFREFGIVSGVGVIICFIFAVVLVPAIDTLLGPLVGSGDRPANSDGPSGIAWGPWPKIRIALLAVGVVVSGVGVPQLDFERDTQKLKAPKQKRGDEVKMSQARQCSKPLVLISDSEADLGRAIDALRAEQGKLLPGRVKVPGEPAKPWVKEIFSLQTAMPAEQAKKAELVAEIRRHTTDFLAQLPELDEQARSYQSHLEALERLAKRDPLTREELPEWARLPFQEKDGTLGRIAHVCLSIHSHELDELVATNERLDELLEGTNTQAADSRLILADLLDLVQRDARRLPGVALLVIFLMIALDLREVRGTLACFASLVVGLGTAVGVMGLLDLNLNFFNLVVMPAVVGLGIDASIHLWHARGSGSLGATGKGSMIAALTTLAGFSGLLVAAHPGLHSIGEVGVVCIVGCVGMAFVALYPTKRDDDTDDGDPPRADPS